MKRIIVLFSFFAILAGSSCSKDSDGPKQPKPITLSTKGHDVIKASNSFGIDLFRETASEENQNMMLSPLSASTALTMLLNGCNADTYDQLRDMLGYEELTVEEINASYQSLVNQLLSIDPEIQLALANAVWYRQDFFVKQDFLGTMDSSFDATVKALDFSTPTSLQKINDWAKDNTNGKIPKVLNAIDPDHVMFLMNALYFKGNWTYQFDEENTSDMGFTLKDGTAINVKTMRNTIPVRVFYGNGATCVELPYGQQNFAMVIVLPDASLEEFLPGFDKEDWSDIITGLDNFGEPDDMEILLPKFKFEYEKYLNDQLKSLGMVDAFEPYLADLSGISDAGIYVDFVKQNTYVDVNEEGTEAAAVTTIGIKEVSMPPSVIVNKPFIFAIRERMTNTLLFIGKVESPVY